MNLLPQKLHTILGTTVEALLRAWSMLQIETAKARREQNGDAYDGVADLQPQVLDPKTQEPMFPTVAAMKEALSLGQLADLSAAVAALTFGKTDLSAFRDTGAEAGDAGTAPDGEGVGGSPVGAAAR